AGHTNLGMAAAVGFENFASGIGGVTVVAYLSALCNLRFTATQYALLSALASIAGRFITGTTVGALIDAIGYVNFYVLTTNVAVPCRALEEAARWYAEVLGAQPVRILKDRVTFSFGGVLQLVCHLERRATEVNPRAYPRHFGLTFLQNDDFSRMRDHVESLGIKFLVRPMVRFRKTPHDHQSFMIADPSV